MAKENRNYSWPILGIVAIVAVVGLVMLFAQKTGTASEEAAAGEAAKQPICSGWGEYCSRLLLGESRGYTLAGSAYKIKVTDILYQAYAGGVHSATFTVNGKTINLLEGESTTLSDGRFMTLTEVLFQDYAGGVKSASFCLSG